MISIKKQYNVYVEQWLENVLTHWGRVTHICVGNLNIIGLDNGLSPGRRQAIIWTNAGILLIEPWGTNFSEILIDIHTFSFKKIHLKMLSAKWRPFCLGFNVLTHLDKMAAILADDKCINLNENYRIPIRISLKFIPRSPIDNKSASVEVVAWRWTGDKPLPEAMLTQFIDAYMRH